MGIAVTCKDCRLEAHEEWVFAGVFSNDEDMIQILDSEYHKVEL